MVSLSTPIDFRDPEATRFLSGVQGNILKAHGRDYTAHVFVRFPADYKNVRAWISKFADSKQLTTAEQQREQAKEYQETKKPGEPFAAFLLSYAGYKALGVPEQSIPQDKWFKAGLKKHNSVGEDTISDPPPESWEKGFRDDLHAMVLLADDIRARLDQTLKTRLDQLNALGVVSFVERGDKLRYDFGPPRGVLEIEHFGHEDGVSDPRMVVEDIVKEVSQRGAEHWDPSAPLNLVFVPEPNGASGYGSYMVFRKLEQNVRAFDAAKKGLANALDVDVEYAAGLMVGRHRDGTPVIPTATADSRGDRNDFNFSRDRPPSPGVARLCPFHSHIRRANPRGDVPHYIGAMSSGTDEAFERRMRIARRGITYGDRPRLYDSDPSALPQAGVGLLFMCFQASLKQFAIQQSGSDNDRFPLITAFTGLELVIGQTNAPDKVLPQPWPYRDSQDPPQAVREFKIMNLVKMLGGEYFFAPSIGFLKGLAGN